MKSTLTTTLACAAISSAVHAAAANRLETVDFEAPFRATMGSPVVRETHMAPGFGTKTHVGEYRSASALRVSIREGAFDVRQGDGDSFETSVRVYPFGGAGGADAKVELSVADPESPESRVCARMRYAKQADFVDISIVESSPGGKARTLGEARFPAKDLPADIVLTGSREGTARLLARSVATATVVKVAPAKSAFFKGRTTPVLAWLDLLPSDGEAVFVVDNYSAGRPKPPHRLCEAPMRIDIDHDFDPVKAGWPLVFEDDFDGNALDETKWYHCWGSRRDLLTVTNGVAHLYCDWKPDKSRLSGVYLVARQSFVYGYFEARVKFTKLPGWWSAFWLCTPDRSNPFVDGQEVDIYEDFYTRRKLKDGSNSHQLHYTYYNFAGGTSKNWNFDSDFEGGFDDWHTIAARWTPFETSFYLDGKLIRAKSGKSAHGSVTFDAVEASVCTTPLYPMLNYNLMHGGGWGFSTDPRGQPFPEDFPVDWVRVYAYPQVGFPSVSCACDKKSVFAKKGERFTFTAEAKPGPDGTPLKAVYLFDSGYLLDVRTEPPYRFDVVFDEDWYYNTRYSSGGGAGQSPVFAKSGLHAFVAFVQDEKGRVASSREILKTFAPEEGSRPYGGKPAAIPGSVVPGYYDEGGQNVAYYDTTPGNVFRTRKNATAWRPDEWVDCENPEKLEDGKIVSGEWLAYTVDIKEAGRYKVSMAASCIEFVSRAGLELHLDGEYKGFFALPDNTLFGRREFTLDGVELPAGRHKLIALFRGRFYFEGLTFKKE